MQRKSVEEKRATRLAGKRRYYHNNKERYKKWFQEWKAREPKKHKNGENKWLRIGARRRCELVRYMGGKCSVCGYKKNSVAIEFHHLGDKSFNITAVECRRRPFAELVQETKKCILLCRCCHGIEHSKVPASITEL